MDTKRYKLNINNSRFAIKALKILFYIFVGITIFLCLLSMLVLVKSFFTGKEIETSFLSPIIYCSVISVLFYYLSKRALKVEYYSFDRDFLYLESSNVFVKIPLENIFEFHKPSIQLRTTNNWEIHFRTEAGSKDYIQLDVTSKKDNLRLLKRILDQRGVEHKMTGVFSSFMF